MKRLALFAASVLFLAIMIELVVDLRQVKPIRLVPTLTGKAEYCLTCHSNLPEISRSHPVISFGCVLCHGGQRLALNADLAHSTLRGKGNPSNLNSLEESCGGTDCHSGDRFSERDQNQRLSGNLHATYAGAIALTRFTYGAQADLTAQMGIQPVQDTDFESKTGILSMSAFDPESETHPLITAFGKECLTCHLSPGTHEEVEPKHFDGCSACHTLTSRNSINESSQNVEHRFTIAIPYSQCNTCHNRGMYDLSTMEFHTRADTPGIRPEDYYLAGTSFTMCEYTLDCIDCHTRQEIMGDGDLYSNQDAEQYIQCKTCHGTLTSLPRTSKITNPEDISLRLAFLNPVIDLKIGNEIIITDKGEPLWTVRRLPDGTFEQYRKISGKRMIFNPVMGSDCLQNPEQQDSTYCHQCHFIQK